MRYWIVGEFADGTVHEWYPAFCSNLLELLRDPFPEIKRTTAHKVHGTIRHHSVPNLPFDPVVVSNSHWIFDLEDRKAVGFTTHDNMIEVITESKEIIEYFDSSTLYTGNYFVTDIESLNKTYKYCRERLNIRPWRYTTHKWHGPQISYRPTKERAYFRGLYIDVPRTFLKVLNTGNYPGMDINFNEYISPEEYYLECASSKVCLSAAGAQNFCNRDIELFAMGVPMIRPRFFSKLDIEIPDDVYIPVEYEQISDEGEHPSLFGYPKEPEKLADDVFTIWKEVKGDEKFLHKVSKNAREFYLEYLSNDRMLLHTENLIIQELQ